MPFALVVNNGFHRLLNVSGVMPVPVSLKVKTAVSSFFWFFIVKVPPFGIASKAFLIMLVNTLLIFAASTCNLKLPSLKSKTWMLDGRFNKSKRVR